MIVEKGIRVYLVKDYEVVEYVIKELKIGCNRPKLFQPRRAFQTLLELHNSSWTSCMDPNSWAKLGIVLLRELLLIRCEHVLTHLHS